MKQHKAKDNSPSLLCSGATFHVSRHGFTLVEMLVALALFTTTISIAVGGFVTTLRTQRQISALIAANNNMSLTLEQMAREIRTGYYFCHPPQTPCSGSDELNFVNANTQRVTYRLDPLVGNAIQRVVDGDIETITSDNVTVQYLGFTLRGNASADGWPPRITISVGVSSNDPTFADTINYIQTTISARQIDS